MRGELLSALLGGLTGAGQGLQQQRAFKYKQDQDAFERQRVTANDSIDNDYKRAQIDALKAPKPLSSTPHTITTSKGIYQYNEAAKRWEPAPTGDGMMQPPTPAKPADLITGVGPDGKPRRMVDTPGVEVPGPASTGAASILKDVAANRAQMATIEKAIAAIEANPDAVGVKRAMGMLPGFGRIGEMVNQKTDPQGIETRNAVQNVGSLTIKNRSGQAVTGSEFERLGFIPDVGYDHNANTKKLRDLLEYVRTETDALEHTAGPRSPIGTPQPSPVQSAPATAKPVINADQVLFLRTKKGMSMAEIQARYTIRP